tara:strand:+ start:1449 stop:1730 length:282 start_codon:yes stop_codon:yes gene_type:complete
MPLPEIHYDEWFHDEPPHPHDSMPIARDFDNPRPEEEISGWFKDETEPLDIPIQETLHQKMYEIATAKYNPFAIGGSESIHDFEGGSENVQRN